jgi:hypothetical protein
MLISRMTPSFMPSCPAAFTGDSKSQGGPNVITRDVREIAQNLVFHRSALEAARHLNMTPCADLRTPDNDAGLGVNFIVHSLGQCPQRNRGGCGDT